MDADSCQIGLRPDILPEALDVLKRVAFGIARKYAFATFGHATSDRAQQRGRDADWRAMKAALLGRGGRLDPDGGFEIELIPALAQHFAGQALH